MGVLVTAIFVIAALVTIIAFFNPKESKEIKEIKKEVQFRDRGMFNIKDVEFRGQEIGTVRTVVEIIREYENDEVHVKHTEIFGKNRLIEGLIDYLNTEYSFLDKTDIVWEKKKE